MTLTANDYRQDCLSASYTRPDRQVRVTGFWNHRGGALWLGEIAVHTARGTLRFSSSTPFDSDGLAGYATDDYLVRFASRFH